MKLKPDQLRAIRTRRLLTQVDLALKAGLTEATVNRIENGTMDPRISTVRKIAQALDVDPDELVEWDGLRSED